MSFLVNPGPGKIPALLSIGMAAIFLGLGFLFLFTNTWIDSYPKPSRTYIGMVLVGWSVFRGITVWMKLQRMKREEQEDEDGSL